MHVRRRILRVVIADRPAHTLPATPTPLIGREVEVAEASTVLARDDVRLLTLTGPGGVGKTRLALAVAVELRMAFPDGVWFVSLASVAQPALVIPTLAQALGVRDGGGVPLQDALATVLSSRECLAVLDNFEHVLAAAPAVAELLAACPRFKVLVTSRAPLHLRAERIYPVPPLAAPSPEPDASLEAIGTSAAVRLFAERAAAMTGEFALTAENARAVAAICARLDGLPLAIELAAGRTRLFSPAELLTRLERAHGRAPLRMLTGGALDSPARQRTLRDTITWSHDLLDEGERTLFRRLAVFAGGCTLEAAEAVCNADGDLGQDLPDIATLLADKSLLRVDRSGDADQGPRLMMLETIREYAVEQLDATDERPEFVRRHAGYYLALVERSRPEQRGPGHLVAEQDNIRAALDAALTSANVETALRFAGALYPFWYQHGSVEEGSRWVARALAATPGGPAAARAKALETAGMLAWARGDLERAQPALEECLALYQELQEMQGAAWVLNALGMVAVGRGDRDAATPLWEQSVAIYRRFGDGGRLGWVLNNLGLTALLSGDRDRAQSLLEESLDRFRQHGDVASTITPHYNLSRLARERGDLAGARNHVREGLARAVALGNRTMIAGGLIASAIDAVAEGQPERAVRLMAAGEALRETTGVAAQDVSRAYYGRALAEARSCLGEESFASTWQAGRALSIETAVAEALAPAEPLPSPPTRPHGLTAREHEVLRLVAAGQSNAEIADALVLSVHTVERHVANIFAKLGAHNRAEAAAVATRQGLV
jgi:predicted ATPase/DNA-binding NarL/FixJ family response regulator